jgi:hypothetical protein
VDGEHALVERGLAALHPRWGPEEGVVMGSGPGNRSGSNEAPAEASGRVG